MEPLFINTTTGNLDEDDYHSRTLPNSLEIKLSSTPTPPAESQIGPLQINSKKFNVYTVPNVETICPISHEVKDKQPGAQKSTVTHKSDMINKNKMKSTEQENLDFSFYFHTPNGHNLEDASRSSSSEILKERMSKFKLLAQEKNKEDERKRREAELKKIKDKKESLKERTKIPKKETELQGEDYLALE